MNPSSSPEGLHAISASERLMSLDALRGFDMFWIVGADAMGHALAHMQGGWLTTTLAQQLEHVPWAGFRFYDLIFPLFAFMIGVAITFSVRRLIERSGPRVALRRIFQRAVLLYLLGLFYYGGMTDGVGHIRYVGVLHRLAFCYLGAGLLFVWLRPRGLVVACGVILLGYWALMASVPIRDIRLEGDSMASLAQQQGNSDLANAIRQSRNPSIDDDRRIWEFAQTAYSGTTRWTRGKYEPGYNVANHVDFRFLPGRKWDGYYDPEGLLSNIPAVVSSLLGVLAGLWLQRKDRSQQEKVLWLAVAGVSAVILGFLWGIQFPVIKKIWTSSYVLVAGGYSAILLALFYLIIDVWAWRRWAQPFVWIGCNALTIYLISNIVDFEALSLRLAGGEIAHGLDALWPGLGGLGLATTGALLCFLICRFLYVRKLFLRL